MPKFKAKAKNQQPKYDYKAHLIPGSANIRHSHHKWTAKQLERRRHMLFFVILAAFLAPFFLWPLGVELMLHLIPASHYSHHSHLLP